MTLPLRLRTALNQLTSTPRNRRRLAAGAFGVSACVCLAFLVCVTLRWADHEALQLEKNAVEIDAAAFVYQIAGELEALVTPPFNDTVQRREKRKEIEKLATPVLANHDIVLALAIVDIHNRIVFLAIGQRLQQQHFEMFQPQYLIAFNGSDARTLVGNLETVFPDLEVKHSGPIKYNGSPNGHLWLLIEPKTPAIALIPFLRLMIRVGLLLLTLGCILGLIAIFLRRWLKSNDRRRADEVDAERLAYVGALAAGLAHEIGNPLNALAMQLEMLEEDVTSGEPGVDDPVTRRLARIRAGLGGVDKTVREFLSYASPGRQSPHRVELAPFVDALCREFEENRPETELVLERRVAPALAAWCDPHALRQIITNLLSNGLRAQQKDGRSGEAPHALAMSAQESAAAIESATSAAAAASSGSDVEGGPGPARLRVEAARGAGGTLIYVDDGGPGVSDAIRADIFDCFFTTRSDGTGLGPAIARRLTEMNRGELELAAGRGALGGARFVLRLPGRRA